MRVKKIFVILIALLLLMLGSCNINYTPALGENKLLVNNDPLAVLGTGTDKKIVKEIKGDIEFTIEFDKSSYMIGDDVIVYVAVKNIGRKSIKIVANTTTFGKSGTFGITLWADGQIVNILSNYSNAKIDCAMYYGLIAPGEVIEKTIIFYTSAAYYSIKDAKEFSVMVGLNTHTDEEQEESQKARMSTPIDISMDFTYNAELFSLIDGTDFEDEFKSVLLHKGIDDRMTLDFYFDNTARDRESILEWLNDESVSIIQSPSLFGLITATLPKSKIIGLIKEGFPYPMSLQGLE